MRIALHVNPAHGIGTEIANQAVRAIGSRAETLVVEGAPREVGPGLPRVPWERLPAEVVLTIGGDGSYLYALQRTDRPLLPLNAGTLGILAEVDGRRPDRLVAAIDRLIAGRYFIEERMKLAVDVGGAEAPDAANEVVLHSGRPARVGAFDVELDGRSLGRLMADAMIVATPNGSTGYALSTLGPIVEPGVEGIVLSALAPFRAANRALVVDPMHVVTLRLLSPPIRTTAIVDGQAELPVPPKGVVRVYRSPRRARFVRLEPPHLAQLRGKGILPWEDGRMFSTEGRDDADLPPPA